MSLDLSQKQRISAREITRKLQQETRAFQEQWGARLRQIQKKANELGRQPGEDALKVRQELQAIKSKQPDVSAVQETLWNALDSEQQVAMREAIEQLKKKRSGPRFDQRKDEGNDRSDRGQAMDEQSRRRLRFLLDERRKAGEDRPESDSQSD